MSFCYSGVIGFAVNSAAFDFNWQRNRQLHVQACALSVRSQTWHGQHLYFTEERVLPCAGLQPLDGNL